MATKDASLRQDLIENAVQHEVVPIDETVPTEQSLDASFAAELEHDLKIWPREYLETYLDSDDQGRIPLNEATLQDLLEAAFDRNEQLIHSSRQGLFHRPRRAWRNRIIQMSDLRIRANYRSILNHFRQPRRRHILCWDLRLKLVTHLS